MLTGYSVYENVTVGLIIIAAVIAVIQILRKAFTKKNTPCSACKAKVSKQ
jgi:hypothetical protein